MDKAKPCSQALGDHGRTHHVHAFRTGSPDVHRHVAFRDYLTAHPDVAMAYSDLKRQLAKRHPEDAAAYMDGKDPFIKAQEAKALAWLAERGHCP